MELQELVTVIAHFVKKWNMTYHHSVKLKHRNKYYDLSRIVSFLDVDKEMCFVLETDESNLSGWHSSDLPPRRSPDSDLSEEVLITDGRSRSTGTFSFIRNVWLSKGVAFSTSRITHWHELPELPNEHEIQNRERN